jgi:hypothetical protein
MADIGYRRKGDTGPLYHPERDYAYITPTLMRAAIERLEANEPEEWYAWRQEQKITQEEILRIAEALAEAQRDFVNAADPVSSFDAALQRHGFLDCRFVVRQYLFAALGEICCAAWFHAVREVSVMGEESPAQTDMARFSAAVREFVNKHRSSVYDVSFLAENLRMRNDVLRAREQALTKQCHAQALELARCRDEVVRGKHAANCGLFTRLWRRLRGRA